MRVLWLSPWMRPLARVYCEALADRGAEVLLVTSDQHPESDAARPYELVLDPRFRTPHTWGPFRRARRRTSAFRADVVVTELVRDPRWIAFAGTTARVQLVHDDRAHDPAELRPPWERAVFERWGAGSAATVTFSHHVRAAVAERADVVRTEVSVVPLTSDLDAAKVPAPRPTRRDFVMVGRLNGYKNAEVVLAAWERHVGGSGWRGDELVLLGEGDAVGERLPPHTRWQRGRYTYADAVSTIAGAKGSVALYRRASQSGTQVLSMQLGVSPIVSTVGALPEFQPPGCAPVDPDDVDGAAAAFDLLADPATADRLGAAARRHYDRAFAAPYAAEALESVLSDVIRRRRRAAGATVR